MAVDSFDPAEFKERQRAEWRRAAAGWRRWQDMLEADQAGRLGSATLVELARIEPGASVLDVGGGYGEPSLTAARAVGPEGKVVCTDLSAGMLAFGQERASAAGLDNVEFVERDAEQLDFEPESFDAVISRATLMLLPDVAGTLARLHSFLRPGGRLAASVWGAPADVQFAAAVPVILEELQLPPPPPGRPGIHALADPVRLSDLVSGAGFREVETDTVSAIFETETPEQFTQFLRDVAPPVSRLVEDQPSAVQERVWARVTQTWKRFLAPDGHVRTHNEAILVTGAR
jgi:enediyne biosynthesis protein CalE5